MLRYIRMLVSKNCLIYTKWIQVMYLVKKSVLILLFICWLIPVHEWFGRLWWMGTILASCDCELRKGKAVNSHIFKPKNGRRIWSCVKPCECRFISIVQKNSICRLLEGYFLTSTRCEVLRWCYEDPELRPENAS